MVKDLIGGQFANNLRRMFGMPGPAPVQFGGESPKAPGPMLSGNGIPAPRGSEVASGEQD